MDLLIETDKEYHSKAKQYLSSHQLNTFRMCPKLYFQQLTGAAEREDTPAMQFGRAAHTFILERHKFASQYVVGGPVNDKTGEPYGLRTKAYREWLQGHGGKVGLSHEQEHLLVQMGLAVHGHPVAGDMFKTGLCERVLRREYCGVPCQIRMDWLSDEHGIIDLKTIDDIMWFESEVRKYGYVNQMAFYWEMCCFGHRKVLEVIDKKTGLVAEGVTAAVINQMHNMPVHLVAVEKKEPFRCGVWVVPPLLLNEARAINEAAIEQWKQCKKDGVWPTGFEEERVLA
jgi:hypothetical protein